MAGPNLATIIRDALDRYERLTEVGEAIEDEWTYLDDLRRAWRARLEAVSAARGDEPASPAVIAAVAAAGDEVALISDPHRAIDWASTFPQVVLTAIGERP